MRASVSSWPGEPGDTRRPAKFTTLNQQHWVTNTYTHTGSSSNTELSEYQPYTSYVITTPTLSADTDNSSDPGSRPSAAQSWPELSMAACLGQRTLEAVRGNGYAPVRGSPVMKSHYISSILTEWADSSIHHMPVRICVQQPNLHKCKITRKKQVIIWAVCNIRRVGFLPAETCFCRTCGLNRKKPGSCYRTDMNSPEITGMSYSLTQSIYCPLVDLYYTLLHVIP